MESARVKLVNGESKHFRRVAIAIFHDADGRVDRYFTQMLTSLRPFCERILVVVNGVLSDAGEHALRAASDDVLVRENEGWDVAAYDAGLRYVGWDELSRYDELLLINNTFFAPLNPWEPVFEAAAAKPEVSIWGLTEHAEIRPHPFLAQAVMPRHLQSYFLAIRADLLASKHFRDYWDQMPPIRSYRDSVGYHEARFTPYFAALGYRYAAVYPASEFSHHDPAVDEPGRLLELGCPTLKRRVFFHDPLHLDECAVDIPGLMSWARGAGLDEDLLLEGVVRVASPRTLVTNAALMTVVCPGVKESVAQGSQQRPVADAETPESAAIGSVGGHVLVTSCDAISELMATLAQLRGLSMLVCCCADEQIRAALEEKIDNASLSYDVHCRISHRPDAGRLYSLLTDAADLVDNADYIVRLPLADGAGRESHISQWDSQCNSDIMAVMSDLFASHSSLGVTLRKPPIRGNQPPRYGWDGLEEECTALARCGHIETLRRRETDTPPWSGGGIVMVRSEIHRHWDLEQIDDSARHYSARSIGEALERLEVLCAANLGLCMRYVMSSGDVIRDFSAVDYRYRALAQCLPGGVEEQQRYLASRGGPAASAGAALRREVERRFPGAARALTPAYRRVRQLLRRG